MGYGKNPEQIKKLIRRLPKDYQETVDRALRADEEYTLDGVWDRCKNISERQLLADIYLKSRDYYDKLKDSEEIWNHIFVDLGYNEVDNPFITLLNNFRWANIDSIDKQNCQQVCNAYSDRTIGKEDFEDKQSIVYNPNLYSSNNRGYAGEYLSEWDKFKPKDYKAKLEQKVGRTLTDDEIRSFIFFGLFDTRPDTGILVPLPTIKKTMSDYKDQTKSSTDRTKKISDLLKYDTKQEAIGKLLKSMSSTERAEVLKAIMDAYKEDLPNI